MLRRTFIGFAAALDDERGSLCAYPNKPIISSWPLLRRPTDVIARIVAKTCRRPWASRLSLKTSPVPVAPPRRPRSPRHRGGWLHPDHGADGHACRRPFALCQPEVQPC